MELARFREILDTYGAEPRRWPRAEREPAEMLLADSAEARELRDDAMSLDALLDLSAAPAPSAEMRVSILAAAQRSGWRLWLAEIWPLGPAWQPASAFAAAVLLGVAVGISVPEIVLPDPANGIVEDVESLALGPTIDLEDTL